MIPHFETAGGVVDGVNLVFTTSLPYTPRTLAVFLNGTPLDPLAANGWLELAPGAGQFEMKEAPLVGDIVRVYFLDTVSLIIVQEVSEIVGVLEEVTEVSAAVEEIEELTGTVVGEG